jgi:hypothetical protein
VRRDEETVIPMPTAAEAAFVWFHRIMAGYCLLFGTLYWVRLAGVFPGADWRFDLMSPHWRIAATSLAILFPFAATGLWMAASWGAVVWFICALAEVAMYVAMPDLFGYKPAIGLSHAFVIALYLAFRLVIARQRRAVEH